MAAGEIYRRRRRRHQRPVRAAVETNWRDGRTRRPIISAGAGGSAWWGQIPRTSRRARLPLVPKRLNNGISIESREMPGCGLFDQKWAACVMTEPQTNPLPVIFARRVASATMSSEPPVAAIPLPGPNVGSSMTTVRLRMGSENISQRVRIASSFRFTSVCADPNAPVARTNRASTSHRLDTDKVNFTVAGSFDDNAQLSMTISAGATDKYGPRAKRTPPQPVPRKSRSVLGAL